MNIDVGKAIKELLFEHPTVIIPGLGGFTSSSNSATVDYVQGMVTPPAKKLEFNSNLVINDGILIGHIQKGDVVTAQQAKEAVESFVENVKGSLERREIVEFLEIGRLYKDYEHKVRFMPEGTNFEANSFGLPGVQFSPVIREKPRTVAETGTVAPKVKPVAATAATTSATASTTASSKASKAVGTSQYDWVNKLWPVLIVVAAILVALSLFVLLQGDDDASTAKNNVKEERLNVKPKPEQEAAIDNAQSGQPDEDSQASSEGSSPAALEDDARTSGGGTPGNSGNSSEESSPRPTESETSTPPVASGKTTTFIVVHSFGVRENARKFTKKLTADGFTAHTVKQGKLYRVGALVEHETQAELDAIFRRLQSRYETTPKVVDYK